MRFKNWILLWTLAFGAFSEAQQKEIKVEAYPQTPSLLEAVKNHDTELVQAVLKSKTNLEVMDSQKRTPLLIATQNNDVEIARLLIEAGADVNAQDQKQDSPLLYAGAEGRLQILRLIISKGKPNFKIYNRYGGTALIPACERGHVDIVKELLKTKIDINHKNNLGWTALMETIVLGDGGPRQQEILQLLVNAKADFNIPDNDGITPLAHAKRRKFAEMVNILEKAGAL
ncbi:ankyrin repeat domain-containing protein [Bdellovibrio bacteriovorus]|uniref:ankyrin repeat domain-containing protein n=1 Tax=Bdellovibrio TaxID=958 RepID=UPI0035A81850